MESSRQGKGEEWGNPRGAQTRPRRATLAKKNTSKQKRGSVETQHQSNLRTDNRGVPNAGLRGLSMEMAAA